MCEERDNWVGEEGIEKGLDMFKANKIWITPMFVYEDKLSAIGG